MIKHNFKTILFFSLLFTAFSFVQKPTIKIAKLKYNGGGDWYANKTSLPNLIKFCNDNLKVGLVNEEDIVEVGSKDIFNYPFIHLTGHGNIVFNKQEAENLRNYLMAGGFLHADDNYGLNLFFRREMKKVFPELEFVELPFLHQFINKNINLPQVCQKYMSMMVTNHKVLDLYGRVVWFVTLAMNAI